MASSFLRLTRLLFSLLSLLLASPGAQQSNPDSLRVVWADADRFWQTYDQLVQARTRADSIALFDARYLVPNSVRPD